MNPFKQYIFKVGDLEKYPLCGIYMGISTLKNSERVALATPEGRFFVIMCTDLKEKVKKLSPNDFVSISLNSKVRTAYGDFKYIVNVLKL